MAVDEFGREIPAGRGRRDRSPSPYGSPSRGGGHNDGGPSHLFEALPTSRYGGAGSSGGGGSSGGVGRKRKHRSESPPPGSHRRGKNRDPHPSTLYAEQPMLCQYLWKEANPDKSDAEYTNYRRSYCLNYVRTFFNEHMDDSWFRSLYSPLGKYNVAAKERSRAQKEAEKILSELEASIEKNTEGKCFFVLKARLGGGVKQARKLPGDDYHHSSPSKSSKSSSSTTNPVPSTHVLSLTNEVLPVQDVPPYVTDEQLTMALMNHCPENTKPSDLTIYSSTPGTNLSRTVYVHSTEAIRRDIIQQLNHVDRGPSASSNAADGAHVPRKEDTYIPKQLELQVECSDAYGRLEYDADGKGGPPEEGDQVRDRKASVWVSTVALTPNVQVLSAAVSSRDRISQDLESARSLAKSFDKRHDIPSSQNLESILEKASLDSAAEAQDIEDALDVSIAYLRRVHLFTFYNGCTFASNVADVLSGSHPTSTVHLRLANADGILSSAKEAEAPTPAPSEGESEAPPKVDLLVQRLNVKIEKALELCKEMDDLSGSIVCKEIDTQAKDIQEQESQVEDVWIQDHALVDEDGRARCSFHFCRKLFKDSSFLKKHLMKKHSEFLRAEMAKCHDSFMMKAWDSQEQRPVPPILVDCGRAFSVRPSPVIGASEPMAEDPEPELWRRQEEIMKQEEEEAEARRERYHPPPDLDGPLSEDRGHDRSHQEHSRGKTYVDVDDMQEEKVEIAFDKIEIPVQPPKKKKKKKKKLL